MRENVQWNFCDVVPANFPSLINLPLNYSFINIKYYTKSIYLKCFILHKLLSQ